MPNHSIGNEVFEFWDGDPPHLVQRIVETFARPGVDGVAQQLAGIRGESFEAILTAHLSSYNVALIKASDYRSLVGAGLLNVVYNNLDFYQLFQHRFTVDHFEPLEIQAAILTGPTIIPGVSYYYPNGGIVRGRFIMTPHKV